MSSTNNQGSALNNSSNSLSGLVSTLVPVALVAGIYLSIFLTLRRSQRRYYAPRTYLGSLRESERTPALPNGLFNWFRAFSRIPDVYALQHQSLDAYLFLRYLRMTIVLCFVGCCITWPVLFPVNATGGGGMQQLDLLSYSNIDPQNNKNRYYAHVFICWLYFGFVMYLIMRECVYYINLRQAFLLSPLYSRRISTRTVLFTSVPDAYLDEARLRKVLGDDVVLNIWVAGDTEALDKLVAERDKVAYTLEKAEVKLIKEANKARQKSLTAKSTPARSASKLKSRKVRTGGSEEADKEASRHGSSRSEEPIQGNEHGPGDDAQPPLDAESGSIAARWVPAKKRPTHRTGFFGLVGKKVDSIEWCRTELERLVPAVEEAQAAYRAGGKDKKKLPGVFVEFRTQRDAETAAQVLAHHQGLQMTPRYIGVTPGEVVWGALGLSWWQRLVRGYAVTAFIAALIIFWAIPVAVVGAISNINNLERIYFLTWIANIPPVILGVVTGLLPSVALSILMSLVPVVMRFCARLAGEPSLSRVELYTQNAYFAFQVIQVFLITTVASSASAVADQIARDPSSATTLLSGNLPKASNFYIPYFIVQGLGAASGVVSQVVGFVIFTIMYRFFAGTPRALYNKWANLSAISWGSTLPVYTNIVVIAITYAGIAPLMLGFAAAGMSLFYLAYRYNILFVTDTQIDTRGLIYPRALMQLFTGIYLAEVCMIGLFACSVAPGPLVLMVVFLIFTVLFHISLNKALDPLLANLPMTLLAEEQQGGFFPLGGIASSSSQPAITSQQPSNKKPNFFTKFLQPWRYADYETLRSLVPHRVGDDNEQAGATTDPAGPAYAPAVARDAYFPPSVVSTAPLLWIPTDPAGVSKQEVAHSSRVIDITDEGCQLDEKGHLVWDQEGTRPPVWEEKVQY